MNYPENTETWGRGHVVIHDYDAKEPKMLMRIVGFTRDTHLAKCQYVLRSCHTREIYPNELKYLHDPRLFGIDPVWGEYAQDNLDRVQREWEHVRRWNLHHQPGRWVVTTSADGGFIAQTTGKARMSGSSANVYLNPGGGWWLRFVEPANVYCDI